MMNIHRTLRWLIVMSWTCLAGISSAGAAPVATEVRNLTWFDLLPDNERNVPAPSSPAAGLFDHNGPAMTQTGSSTINNRVDGWQVKVPGYIVPLDMEGDKVRSFFLVPYYGACIHVPPPAPNQMIYVELPEALSGISMYEAQWVIGTLSIKGKTNPLATASYSLKASKVLRYTN